MNFRDGEIYLCVTWSLLRRVLLHAPHSLASGFSTNGGCTMCIPTARALLCTSLAITALAINCGEQAQMHTERGQLQDGYVADSYRDGQPWDKRLAKLSLLRRRSESTGPAAEQRNKLNYTLPTWAHKTSIDQSVATPKGASQLAFRRKMTVVLKPRWSCSEIQKTKSAAYLD